MNPVQLVSDLKQLTQDLDKCKNRYKLLQERKQEIDSVDLQKDVVNVQNEFQDVVKTVKK